MKYLSFLLIAMSFYSISTLADKDTVINKHKSILLEKYPSAIFVEVEKDKYKGQEIWEYEFIVNRKKYEAFMTESGEIKKLNED